MNVREGLESLRTLPPGAVASIGNFDGLHLGHQAILSRCDQLRSKSGLGKVAVITFEPHPLTVLKPELTPPRLSPLPMKREQLAEAGVDECIILPPTPDILGLSAEAFWAILKDEARISHLVEGETFVFGRARGGTMPRLREWAVGSGIGIHSVEPVSRPLLDLQIVPVSSSIIRFLIDCGRVREAAILLGRPYVLEGPVIKGHQRGRTIGIPTANLDCRGQLVPADGVYAASCTIVGKSYTVALSIGTLPTFGEHQRQVEGYILGFEGDLYGKTLQFEVIDWIREQWKLPGIDALKSQIAKDVREIEKTVAKVHPAHPIAV